MLADTLIIIEIFAGFFFLVVRPLQKRSGKYGLPKMMLPTYLA